jgi:hypothetical protein
MAMKRVVPLLCLILSALVILGGCGGTAAKPPDNTVAEPPSKSGPWAELTPPLSGDLEKPDWPVVSIVPEDYGIVYEPESLSELAGYPLDKLIAYYLGSDGAYAEGSSYELYRRFLDAPNTVLTVIALIGDEAARGETFARDLLCQSIALSAAWSDDGDAFSGVLERCEKAFPVGSVAEVLTCLKGQYAAAISQSN